MCRSIKTLHHFEPPATRDEVHAAALQFVRKISGFTKPSQANQAPFDRAIEEITAVADRLMHDLVGHGPKKNREVEAAKAKARAIKRYGA